MACIIPLQGKNNNNQKAKFTLMLIINLLKSNTEHSEGCKMIKQITS